MYIICSLLFLLYYWFRSIIDIFSIFFLYLIFLRILLLVYFNMFILEKFLIVSYFFIRWSRWGFLRRSWRRKIFYCSLLCFLLFFDIWFLILLCLGLYGLLISLLLCSIIYNLLLFCILVTISQILLLYCWIIFWFCCTFAWPRWWSSFLLIHSWWYISFCYNIFSSLSAL